MKRILVVNPYGIGDVLFSTPLLKSLKEAVRPERIDVLLGSRTREVLKNNPNVDTIYSLDKDELRALSGLKRAWKIYQFYKELKKNHYDVFIDLSLTREYAFFAKYYLRIPRRVGFDYKKRGCFLNLKEPLPNGFTGQSVPKSYSNLLKLLSLTPPEKLKMEFVVNESVSTHIWKRLRAKGILKGARIVAVSAGGGASWGRDAPFKQWPPRYFRGLLEKIHLMYPIDVVVFLGGRADDLLNHEVSRDLSFSSVHLADYLTLEETAAVFKLSRFALLNEGGLCHVAATQGTPIISVVGPVDEKVYGPVGDHLQIFIKRDDLECRPCYQKFRYNSECEHQACLKELMPEDAQRTIIESRFLQNLERAQPRPDVVTHKV